MNRLTPMTGIALLLTALPLLAQDAGLYEQVTDPDAAYIRVIAQPNAPALVQTTAFEGLATGVSPYVVITEPGEVKVSAGLAEAVATVTPGSWQTFAVAADGTGVLLQDQIMASPAQADVALFNLSDKPLVDLFVPAAKAVAVAGVAEGSSGGVALKAPLTLDFEVREGDTVLASVSGVELRRRDGVTFVFRGTEGAYELIATPNSIAR